MVTQREFAYLFTREIAYIYIYRDLSVLWYRLAGTPPDWRYCQINSIIIDYGEQSVLIEWDVWV